MSTKKEILNSFTNKNVLLWALSQPNNPIKVNRNKLLRAKNTPGNVNSVKKKLNLTNPNHTLKNLMTLNQIFRYRRNALSNNRAKVIGGIGYLPEHLTNGIMNSVDRAEENEYNRRAKAIGRNNLVGKRRLNRWRVNRGLNTVGKLTHAEYMAGRFGGYSPPEPNINWEGAKRGFYGPRTQNELRREAPVWHGKPAGFVSY
jgi:hypothetical protein